MLRQKSAHPARRVRLLENRASRQLLRSVEQRDVVEPEKAALEDVVALAVDLVDPPGEVDQQLVEAALEERAIGLARADAVHVVDTPDRPRMHRRIEVGELPLVRRDLPVRVLELLEQHEPELLLREIRVDQRNGDGVKGEVPGREPGVFPLVRHRQHAHRVQVPPVLVADLAARHRWRQPRVVAVEPLVDVEDVVLLGPHQPGEGLTLHPPLVLRGALGVNLRVELVRFVPALADDAHRRRPEASPQTRP